MDPSKTEQPTGKRLGEAKKKGNVGKSMDVSEVISLFTAFMIINVTGFFIYRHLIDNMQMSFSDLLVPDFNEESLSALFSSNVKDVVIIVAPIMGGLLFVGMLGAYLQTGFRLTLEPIKPTLNKLNPVSGVKNLFSLKSVMKLIMGVLKVTATAVPAYFIIKKEIVVVQGMTGVGFAELFI